MYKREVTWGNSVATFNNTNSDTFGHEYGHIIQVREQGWARFQARGNYESKLQVLLSLGERSL